MIGQWGEVTFELTGSNSALFDSLKMSAGCDTDDQSSNSQKYVSYKEGKGITLGMTILLHAGLGNDVRQSIMKLQNAAQRGTQDYLTLGGEKIYPFKLMLTKADADKILISPKNQWVSAEVSASWTQSSQEWIISPPPPPAPVWVDDWGYDYGGGGNTSRQKTVQSIAPTGLRSKIASVAATVKTAAAVAPAASYSRVTAAVAAIRKK